MGVLPLLHRKSFNVGQHIHLVLNYKGEERRHITVGLIMTDLVQTFLGIFIAHVPT